MKRSNPVAIDMPKMDPHEEMLSDMHSALSALGDKIRKPYAAHGEKLLPKNLRTSDNPDSKHAKKHIKRLHKAFKAEK